MHTFINLDFNTSMASITILQKNSPRALKLQCHNRVRRERSTYAWRVAFETRSSRLNILYTLSRRPTWVTHELLKKWKLHEHSGFEPIFYKCLLHNKQSKCQWLWIRKVTLKIIYIKTMISKMHWYMNYIILFIPRKFYVKFRH